MRNSPLQIRLAKGLVPAPLTVFGLSNRPWCHSCRQQDPEELMRFHRFCRVHVGGLHEPSWFIRSNGQEGDPKFFEARSQLRMMGADSRIT